MAISYSFHISSKQHALTNTNKVSGVSKHNLRKYEYSDKYKKEDIIVLRGSTVNIL